MGAVWVDRAALPAGLALLLACGCGLTDATQRRLDARGLNEFVVWRDPATGATSRDFADANGDQMSVTTDGRVVLRTGDVCPSCRVNLDTAAVLVNGTERASIRWVNTVGADLQSGTADDGRRPVLVDSEGRLIVVEVSVADGNVTTDFRSTNVQIESPNDPSDDTAVRDSTVSHSPSSANDCGAGAAGAAGLILPFWLGLAAIARPRRRWVR